MVNTCRRIAARPPGPASHSDHLNIVTVQCLIVTGKNPFQIGFADGIFAFKPMFYYGQRSKRADLLNSYHLFLFLVERFKFPAASFIEPAEQLVVLETEYLDPDDQALHAAHEQVSENNDRYGRCSGFCACEH